MNHKWITNQDFMNHKWRFSFSWYLPLDSDVIEYFKYEKKWVFSGKVCWNCSSNASEEAWSSMQKALKEDKLVYQTVKLYVGLSISLESSWACDVYFPIIMLVSILRMQWNQSSTASLEKDNGCSAIVDWSSSEGRDWHLPSNNRKNNNNNNNNHNHNNNNSSKSVA